MQTFEQKSETIAGCKGMMSHNTMPNVKRRKENGCKEDGPREDKRQETSAPH